MQNHMSSQTSQTKLVLEQINTYITNQQLNLAKQELETLLQKEPQNCLALIFMAHIHRKMSDLEEALNWCNKALSINPKFYTGLVEKARILAEQDKHVLACHIYIEIYQLYPNISEYFIEWCRSLAAIGDFNTLHQIAEVAINFNPKDADLYFYLGLILQYKEKHQDSIRYYEKALKLAPNMPMLLNNLGAAYKECGNYTKAKEMLELELQKDPNNHLAWTNYGSVLQKLDRLQESYNAHLKSITLVSDYAISYNNLALTLREMQDFTGAEQALESSIKMDSNYMSAKWNLAMIELVKGNYEKGWPLHEYRWQGSNELRSNPHGLPQPEWDGTQNLNGKKIFLWGEQGFGDALQFCRYVPYLANYVSKQGGELIYCCFTALHELCISSFQNLIRHPIMHDKQRPLPDFDYHVPLLKLPLIFNTTEDTIPNTVPYIRPSLNSRKKFNDIFENNKDFKVGLIWTGSKVHQRNPYRSVGIENYIRFKNIENTSFYGLQFDAKDSINLANSKGFNIQDLTDNIANFDESAALLQKLDLVITTCTSTAHLAGALGIPTWVLLDVNPHWVWFLDRTDSPWYPKTKLYRQKEYKNWEPVLQTVHKDLKALVNAKLAMV